MNPSLGATIRRAIDRHWNALTPIAVAVAAGFVLAGCRASLGSGRVVPTNGLSASDVTNLAGAQRQPGAAAVVLDFWRGIQRRDYRRAYHDLSAAVRLAMSYTSFVAGAVSAGQVFARYPVIDSVTPNRLGWVVSLRAARDGVLRRDSPELIFQTTERQGAFAIESAPARPGP